MGPALGCEAPLRPNYNQPRYTPEHPVELQELVVLSRGLPQGDNQMVTSPR